MLAIINIRLNMEIKNRKALFDYTVLESFTAGIMLTGPEVKSFRKGDCDLADAYCIIENGEPFMKNCYFAEYKQGQHVEQNPRRDRELLLNKREIERLKSAISTKGLALPILKIFINETGLIKALVGIAKGKKNYDKRQSIKDKDLRRESQRQD